MMLCLGVLLLALQLPYGVAAKMSEAELRTHLQTIHRQGKDRQFCDPLQLIQAANYLRPLGKSKALAVMVAYERKHAGQDGIEEVGMFHLARVLFKSDRRNGTFPPDGLFIYNRDSLPDLHKYPTYPILIFQNVPFLCYPKFDPRVETGWPGSYRFRQFAKHESKHWTINPKPLRPPADPFPLVDMVPLSKFWPLGKAENEALKSQIIQLVETGLRPAPRLSFEEQHALFLGRGCRWDAKRQMYVARKPL